MEHFFEQEFKKIIAERKEDVKRIIKEREEDIKRISKNKNKDIKEYKIEDIENNNKSVKDIVDIVDIEDIEDLILNKKKVNDVKYDDIVNIFKIPLFRCNLYTNCVKCKHKKCLYF